jgi:hypothetical protein
MDAWQQHRGVHACYFQAMTGSRSFNRNGCLLARRCPALSTERLGIVILPLCLDMTGNVVSMVLPIRGRRRFHNLQLLRLLPRYYCVSLRPGTHRGATSYHSDHRSQNLVQEYATLSCWRVRTGTSRRGRLDGEFSYSFWNFMRTTECP